MGAVGLLLAAAGACWVVRTNSRRTAESPWAVETSCGGCHAAIARTFAGSAKVRSFRTLPPGAWREPAGRVDHRPSERIYTVEAIDGSGLVTRRDTSDAAEPDAVWTGSIDFSVGSGRRVRSFLRRTPAGPKVLPVAWYAQRPGHWWMAPGYDTARHPDFRAPAATTCVPCHSGSHDRGPTQAEPIGCQTCHGPAAAHVRTARQANARLKLPRLDGTKSCIGCHSGAGHGSESGRGGLDLNSAGDRLALSRCFTVSGSLACVSCHDPHGEAPQRTVTRARDQCVGCHRQAHKPPGDCLDCHMPKRELAGIPGAFAVDHFIRRSVAGREPQPWRPPQREPGAAERAGEFVRKGDLAAALALLRDSPEDWQTLTVRAEVHILMGQTREGAESARAAIAADPDQPAPRLQLALSYEQLRDMSGAIQALREAVLLQPDHALAHGRLGNLLSIRGDTEGARRHLRRAVRLDPDLAEVRLYYGAFLVRQHEYAGAERELLAATRLDPNLAAAFHQLGNLAGARGDAAAAIQYFRRALAADPNLAEAHLSLAVALSAAGRIEAIPHLEKAARSNDPSVRDSARRALQVLAERRAREAEPSPPAPGGNQQ